MTDINTRGKLPFTIVSSSVNTGYATQLTSSVGYNIDIVNHHKDEYGGIENSPLQGPFAAQHVGGNQHRHVKLNNGSDDSDNRPEAYIISASAGAVKVYGPDVNGIHKPRSLLTRDTIAKSPVNIKNIQTSGNVAGNFEHNYQVVQTSGRRITNNLINDNFIASGSLTTQFVSSSRQIYGLPEIENNSKSIFVERFNAPGGKEVSSRGALDREGEEYAPNNSLTTRNIKVRQPYYDRLTQHSKKANNSLQKIFNILKQDSSPRGLFFKPDGKMLYMVGQTTDKVYQYQVNESYNIEKSILINSFSISSQTGTPRGVSFSSDGAKMYIVGSSSGYQYTLSTAWDISTAVFSGISFSFAATETGPTGIFFKSDGTSFYISGTSAGSRIIHYSLTTAWDISTASVSATLSVSSQQTTVTGLYFVNNGKYLYIVGESEDRISFYSLSQEWNISSAQFIKNYSIAEEQGLHDIAFSVDEKRIFLLGTTNDTIYEYDLIELPLLENYTNKNSINKIKDYNQMYVTSSRNDNFWVQHSIPATDLRYKWIADSVSSSQQPIEYQSYNLPYSISNSYNSNGAFTDLSFEQKGPFGDHLGISGAIDKDEMHVSTYTNTMYRDRKYLFFTSSNDCYVDASSISSEISESDFSISFWVNFPNSASNGEKTLLVYSGSSTQNELVMNVSSSLCGLTISGSQTTTEYQLSSSLLDNSWHLVTLTSDVTTLIRRIPAGNVLFYPTVTKVYLDGGLVSTVSQQNKILNLSRITLSVGRGSELQGGKLDEIYFWNQVLTEQEIVEIYRTTKTDYNKQPKKYVQHKLDNSNIPVPTHIYSSDIETNTTTLLDLAGSRNLTLVNFTSSVNIRPQDTGIISYSTYFNGPYQGANWKSIRNAEHPVTRKLTTDNTNIVSVVIPEGPKVITRVIRGTPVRITVPGNRKQGTILNVKESPVYANNKPLKHKFILKDSQNINVGFELTHTYANNLQYFASNQLNLTLGLDKKERQIYDSLLEYYNGSVEANENPIDRLVGYTYSETIFPKPGQALLKDIRQRTDYITNQPGYSIDGYDRQLGTQRAFWRDSQEHRMRTRRTYITSLGDQIESEYDLPFQTPSIAALEYISEGNSLEYISKTPFSPTSSLESLTDFSYKNSAELNNRMTWTYDSYGVIGAYFYFSQPVNQIPEIYFFKNLSTDRDLNNIILRSGLYPLQKIKDPSSLRVSPSFIQQHGCVIAANPLNSNTIYNNMTHDLGLNRFTEKISGKNPWYNSYEDYYVDIKTLSNDNLISYSKIPEFKISDQISQFVTEYGGDATRITLQKYVNDLRFNYKSNIDKDNNQFCDEDTINIVVDGVKKLLPYSGFYPQDRSLQLVNYLKESYLDTNAIGGGIFLTSSFSSGELISTEENDKLVQYMKESAFLEPLYSPGIFYNLIKSGVAVDWSLYTGSLPPGKFVIPLTEKPQFKITFESLLNLQNIPLSSSLETKNNRMMKYKEINQEYEAADYGGGGGDDSFQGFFEKLSEGSPIYTLSINNFLAETINFFLKDSTLNTFISKPDSDFLSFDSDKTYYMDVVLRKNNIVMCEAHSSSLANNFGRMSGRYFGPSFWTGSVTDADRIESGTILAEVLRDPGYCAYTPPYYYGDSIARISFKPSVSSKYNLDDILQEMEIEFMNTGFVDDSVYTSGSLYSSFVMPLDSSITLKGQIEDRQQTVQLETLSRNFSNIVRNNLQNLVGTATNGTGIKRWVISPKMETPVLDFSNQEFVTSTTILTQSNVDIELSNNSLSLGGYIHTPPTASGFGRGMWSGYGEIPEGDKGIFLELKESYPRQLSKVYNSITKLFETTNTASLLQACGFQQTNGQLSKKIGELADSRDISEAIVIIPYLLNNPIGRPVDFGGRFSAKATNNTVQIEGHNFIGIDQKMFNYQKTNLFANKPAVSLQDYDLGVGNIQETSISRMIGLMSKYVLPPNFDFLINENISPFVMYIAEFTSNLDKQDLADVWQGVMPKIAMRAEREKQIISHKNTQFDFFHGQGLPKDVKFMIFKAKKRAEINYYKMTSDSSDDGLFPSIQAGKPPSPYSFNWPYDYCSLVETATVNVEIEYLNNSGSNT